MDCWPSSHEEKKIVSGWLWVFCVFWKSSEKTLQVSNFCYISLDSVESRYCFFLNKTFKISLCWRVFWTFLFLKPTYQPSSLFLTIFSFKFWSSIMNFLCVHLWWKTWNVKSFCTNIDTYHAFWNWNREHGVSSNACFVWVLRYYTCKVLVSKHYTCKAPSKLKVFFFKFFLLVSIGSYQR